MFKASLEYPLEQDLFNQSFAVPICLKVLQNDIVRDEDSLLKELNKNGAHKFLDKS